MSLYEFLALYVGGIMAAVFLTIFFCSRPRRGKRLDPAVEAMIEALPEPGERISSKALRRWISGMKTVVTVVHGED